VLIPSNRIAPVTANALASLNALAPGRIDFGVGTGFTGRRAMGLGAIKLSDMEEYLRVVSALLDGETPELTMEGKRRRIRFLNPELELINLRDPVRLHISAYGPRSRALTAKFGAGWLNFIGALQSGVADLQQMQQAWKAEGHELQDLSATAFGLGCILKEG
jgi:5,10-methylenetetrahydromethanopterin reductase